eukprot:TRINITY_DN24429_c0_g1_i2.p1 TRINITY_DN24429_c0_g1~~TRINITY_DN24429_c0_g1_i2.p1  ORF type:complete len:308 (-),score=43.59 TRINITY_DN24429_c0_g1_i2:65-988(-)
MLHGQSLAKRIAALLCLCYVGIIGGGAAAAPKLYDGDGIIRFLTGELGRLLVIVPGHGKPERTATLLGSIRWLMEEEWSLGEGPECLVFVYNTSATFLGLPPARQLLHEPGVEVVVRPGVFMEFLIDPAVELAMQRVRPDFVLLLLDDIRLQASIRATFTRVMLSAMLHNGLDVASPTLWGSHWGYEGMRPAMPKKDRAVGRLVTFVEYQASFFTAEAFRILCRMIRPNISVTWGYDDLYPGAFRAEMGRNPRIGILDIMSMFHTGKWLTSEIEEETVLSQYRSLVRFYKEQFNISTTEFKRRGYVF